MPIYYFDIRDAEGTYRDDTGLELPDLDSAILEARRTLADMTRENLKNGDERFEILIRDHGEGPVKIELAMTTTRRLDGERA